MTSNLKDKADDDIEANMTEDISIIMDFALVVEMDFTAAKGVRALSKALKKSGRSLYFCNLQDDIEIVLQGADSTPLVVYSTIQDAEQKLRASSS